MRLRCLGRALRSRLLPLGCGKGGGASAHRATHFALVSERDAVRAAQEPDLTAKMSKLQANAPARLAFGAPVYISGPLSERGEIVAVIDVDGALTLLQAARLRSLCFGDDGSERLQWTWALDRAASAKFDPTAEAVEAARTAFRTLAKTIGALARIVSAR